MFRFIKEYFKNRKAKKQHKTLLSLPLSKLKYLLHLDKYKIKFANNNRDIYLLKENYTGIIVLVEYDFLYTIKYFHNGKLHRTNGPATIWFSLSLDKKRISSQMYEWYYEGKRHRIGKPAIVSFEGATESTYKDFIHTHWLWDSPVNKKEFFKWLKENRLKLDKLTEEDEILIRMRWER